MQLSPARWAVALSENVTATPFASHLGARPLVLWRDAAGTTRALEDRCPHRGVPLSAGRVAPDGRIACRDHGWQFDGATGRLIHVPGAKPCQDFAGGHDATVVPVIERGGFIWVTPASTCPAAADHLPLFGVAHVSLGHAEYVAALLDDPNLLVGIRHIRLVVEPVAEPRRDDGHILVERTASGIGPWRAVGRLTLRGQTCLATGETGFALLSSGRTLLVARLAPTPAPRGTTTVRWRASPGAFGLRFKLWPRIDAAALMALEPAISESLATPPAPP